MCRFVEKCWKRQNLTFGDLWWSGLWPDLKMTEAVPSWFLTFFRMSLHGPGAELEGVFPPPGRARSAPSTGPARVKNIDIYDVFTLQWMSPTREIKMESILDKLLPNASWRYCEVTKTVVLLYVRSKIPQMVTNFEIICRSGQIWPQLKYRVS